MLLFTFLPLLLTLVRAELVDPFAHVILPIGTVQNQTNPTPVIGISFNQPTHFSAFSNYSLALTYPNGTVDAKAGAIGIACQLPGTGLDNATFHFDNSQAGSYTLAVHVVYSIYDFSNCTGQLRVYTNDVMNKFIVDAIGPNPHNLTNISGGEEIVTSMPFAPTFTEYAFPYSTGIGRPNMDATSGASEKYLSIMSLVGVVMGIYLLV